MSALGDVRIAPFGYLVARRVKWALRHLDDVG